MHGVLKLDSLLEGNVTQRAMWWSMHITQLLAEDTDLLMSLPDDATLIILPSDDPELCSYNLNLARNVKGVQVLVRLDQVDDRLVLTPYTQSNSIPFGRSPEHPFQTDGLYRLSIGSGRRTLSARLIAVAVSTAVAMPGLSVRTERARCAAAP